MVSPLLKEVSEAWIDDELDDQISQLKLCGATQRGTTSEHIAKSEFNSSTEAVGGEFLSFLLEVGAVDDYVVGVLNG